MNRVEGQIQDEAKNVLYTIDGKWSEVIDITDKKTKVSK